MVLSEKGLDPRRQGHDIDPATLSYKSGDSFKMAVHGRSNQPAIILDSTGRAYTVASHNLPSARVRRAADRAYQPAFRCHLRRYGNGARGPAVPARQRRRIRLCGEAGRPADQEPRRQGRHQPAQGGRVLQPSTIPAVEGAWVAAASNEGRLLMFPLADLPQLARGSKGKIIGIPSARVQSRDEFMVGCRC